MLLNHIQISHEKSSVTPCSQVGTLFRSKMSHVTTCIFYMEAICLLLYVQHHPSLLKESRKIVPKDTFSFSPKIPFLFLSNFSSSHILTWKHFPFSWWQEKDYWRMIFFFSISLSLSSNICLLSVSIYL